MNWRGLEGSVIFLPELLSRNFPGGTEDNDDVPHKSGVFECLPNTSLMVTFRKTDSVNIITYPGFA
jgi:hypothetical protein